MQGISDINIKGVDETRPPVIRKEPYIDIFFELSHQAPLDWCKDLNNLFALNHPTSNATINEKEGLFIKTWVRTPGEISTLLEQLKDEITQCTNKYIERIQLKSQNSSCDTSATSASREQVNLNNIIASLVFD
ncbi:MAG: hypothetical protein OEY78_04545 [Gammaproteobacteria bacterium]|nr:hypothetical protein [Gammaproteobacteria bacterium]